MFSFLIFLCAWWSPEASAQFGSRVSVKASFSPAKAAPGDLVTLKLQAEIEAGYYIYAPDSPEDGGIPARVEFAEPGGLRPEGEPRFTEPKEKWDDIFEVTIRILRGRPTFEQDFRIPDDSSGTIELGGVLHTQVCDDRTCVIAAPTFKASLVVAAAAPQRVTIAARFEPDTAAPGDVVTLNLELRIGDAYYFYAPTSPAGLAAEVGFEPMKGLEPVGKLSMPDPVIKFDEVFEEDVHLYFKEAVFRRQFRVAQEAAPGELEISGTLTGQACDESTCTNESLPFAAVLKVAAAGAGTGVAAAGAGSDSAATPPPQAVEPVENVGGEDLGTMSISAFLLLAVFWGLITLLMPCTYPMIPITISFFTKQAIAREGRVLSLSLAYGAGIVLVFILIGVVLGAPIITFATHPITNLVIGALFLFFALVLFGAIDLQPPKFLMAVAGKASTKSGLTGVFLMGTTLVVTSFTCTAPFVGSLLSVGAGDGDIGRIVLGMGVFGLTMATPFVLLSLLPGRLQRMPRAGEWMHVLKVFLGFVEVAAALKFLSNSDLVWNWGFLSRELFLVLWFGIFLVAALFLFGMIHLKGESEREIGPVRMVGGLCTLLFALYCGLGSRGYVMDDIMTAIVPNYSMERLAGAAGDRTGPKNASGHLIIKDDYQQARREAVSRDRLLLVNFTGHT